jgi:hypothetical protein
VLSKKGKAMAAGKAGIALPVADGTSRERNPADRAVSAFALVGDRSAAHDPVREMTVEPDSR